MKVKEFEDNLSRTSVLTDLTVSAWDDEKVDRAVTREIMEKKKGKTSRGRFTKKLMTEASELESIQRNLKKYYRSLTIPWAGGLRVLPLANRDRLNQAVDKARKDIEDFLNGFKDSYQEAVYVTAKEDLGDLWDQNDYLNFEQFKGKWRITLDSYPIPKSGHYIVDANKKTVEELKQSLGSSMIDRYGNITGDLWKRLYKSVENIVERLTKDRMRFQEDKEVMSDLKELIGLLPILNITKNKQLGETMDTVKTKIADVSDTDLRDEKKKDKVAKEAKKLLEEINKYIESPMKRSLEF